MSDRIEIDGLSKVFRSAMGKPTPALHDIHLDIAPGTFVSVVGPSGCGKTTLLMVLAGLEHYEQGTVRINGEAVRGPRHDVGIVYQRPVLLPWKTTLDNTLLPVQIRCVALEEHRSRAIHLLNLVGLGAFMSHYPTELSGGMAQRNAIARALILDPGLLLMDEPFAALDALTREQMALLLASVWEVNRTTVFFITHSIQEAVILADRVIVMSAAPGRVVADIDVHIPRPRRFEIVDQPQFVELTRQVRSYLTTTAMGIEGDVT